MRVRVRIRVHVTGGVLARGLTCVGRLSEQPHWRWPKQGAAVAEQGGLGELSGLCKVYRPKRRPAEGAVLFRPIMWLYVFGLSCSRFYPAPCFGHIPTRYTLFWPLPKKNNQVHLGPMYNLRPHIVRRVLSTRLLRLLFQVCKKSTMILQPAC